MTCVYPGSSRGSVVSGPMTTQTERGVANTHHRQARELKKGLWGLGHYTGEAQDFPGRGDMWVGLQQVTKLIDANRLDMEVQNNPQWGNSLYKFHIHFHLSCFTKLKDCMNFSWGHVNICSLQTEQPQQTTVWLHQSSTWKIRGFIELTYRTWEGLLTGTWVDPKTLLVSP